MSRLSTLLSKAFLIGTLSAAVALAESPASQSTSGPTVLSITGPQFTLNGKPTFLLGISYYAGAGASERFLKQDLDDLQRFGFNWLRVWATWGTSQQDVSAVDVGGAAREPYFARLQSLIAECDRRGMVVDVTLTRGPASATTGGGGSLPDFAAHRRAVEMLVRSLAPYRNWYLDLANERDVRDDRYVGASELKQLRERVRQLDPARLVTASFGGHDLSDEDIREALLEIGLDFLAVHRPRNADSPAQTESKTRDCLATMQRIGRVAPVHQQEPFRRGYAAWEPTAEDFLTDLHGAVAGGAAGWCFHNGRQQQTSDGQPRRSFDLSTRRLFDQLDQEELRVVRQATAALTDLSGLTDKPEARGSARHFGVVTEHSDGLHGYIGFSHEAPASPSTYSAGMGFYASVWPLIDQPLANFQIGLPSTWITPDNSDNKDQPLAPEGTLARTWRERGPTWSSVFQTVEGGLGYWAGNHFRYGPPKFSMNATPQCYDYEVGSPGWSFFYSNEALPDNRLGIAQLSNRLLIPPDALPFQGTPRGEFLGYTWMALPFTDSTTDDPPTGDQSWTCFLSAANFKGPIAYYIPETWSKIGKLFDYPMLYGRGLDARPGIIGGGAMEINTVPRFDAKDARGTVYSKLPKLQFPVDAEGRAFLVQDVTYYSTTALANAFKAWRDGGPVCSGQFDTQGAWKPTLTTRTTRYDQAGKEITGVQRVFDTKVFEGNVWGLQWLTNDVSSKGLFPQYFKHVGDARVAVEAGDVPAETGLLTQEFKLAKPGQPYTSPGTGAWSLPGPQRGPYTAKLADGSVVTYSWYRFVDQPSFQQYNWSAEKKTKLQAFVEKLHASWPIDRDYMSPPTRGTLVSLDPGLLVTQPEGLEVGYVPIVTRQSAP